MRHCIFLSFLMFIGCLSSPKQQKESFSEKVSDTLVVVKDTENVDEHHLKKAMADALEKITASFQGKDWEYMYDFDTTEDLNCPQ